MFGLPLLPLGIGAFVGLLLGTPVALVTVALLVSAKDGHEHDMEGCEVCQRQNLDAFWKGRLALLREIDEGLFVPGDDRQ